MLIDFASKYPGGELNTVVGVDDGARKWSAVLDRHVPGVNDKVWVLIIIDGPADDPQA